VVNTLKDKDADRLLVKLDNFGLARMYEHPLEDLAEGGKTYRHVDVLHVLLLCHSVIVMSQSCVAVSTMHCQCGTVKHHRREQQQKLTLRCRCFGTYGG
jgi:hypothetical protein